MKNIRQRFVYTENEDVTSTWYMLSGIKDPTLKSLKVKKNTFTLLETGERIEMHKHSLLVPKMGRVEMFYVITGDRIESKTFRLVDKGYVDHEMKLDAEKYFRHCLVKRLQQIDLAPKEEEFIIIDDDEEEYIEV